MYKLLYAQHTHRFPLVFSAFFLWFSLTKIFRLLFPYANILSAVTERLLTDALTEFEIFWTFFSMHLTFFSNYSAVFNFFPVLTVCRSVKCTQISEVCTFADMLQDNMRNKPSVAGCAYATCVCATFMPTMRLWVQRPFRWQVQALAHYLLLKFIQFQVIFFHLPAFRLCFQLSVYFHLSMILFFPLSFLNFFLV